MKRVAAVIILASVFAILGWYLRDVGFLAGVPGPDGVPSEEGTAGAGGAMQSEDTSGHGPVALGRIEPAGGVIALGAPPGDRLLKLNVEQNQHVPKNAPLAVLESRTLRQLELEAIRSQIKEAESRRTAELRVAEAKINAAKAALAQAEAYPLEIQVQQSQVGLLRKNLDLARTTQRRLLKLASTELVSDQDREQQALAVQKAEAELAAAEVLLKKARDTGPLAVAAARAELDAAVAGKEQVETAFSLESLKKREAIAAIQCEQTILRAPCEGTILKVYAREGEAVGTMPILQLADRRRMVVLAEVYEAQVKQICVGQAAKVRSRAFPEPYDTSGLSGTVTRIGKTVSRPELRSLDPLAEVDRHVVEVCVEVTSKDPKVAAELNQVAAEFIHLQVEVEFSGSAKP